MNYVYHYVPSMWVKVKCPKCGYTLTEIKEECEVKIRCRCKDCGCFAIIEGDGKTYITKIEIA